MHDSGLEERFAALARMPAELAERAGRFQPEESRRRTAAGGFSLLEHVCHLADLEEQAFALRIRRVRAEHNPMLADFDGAAAALAGRYQERALAPALAAFAAARARSIELLRSVGRQEWSRSAAQEGVGALTLADLPRLMAEHDAAHRQEMDALRAEMLLGALATAPSRLGAVLGDFSDAALRRPPLVAPVDAEALSAIGHACHLRDIEIDGYHERIRRTRAEANPTLPSLDSERLALERGYDAAELSGALRAFDLARQRTIEDLGTVAPAQWSRPADFEGYGAVTLLGLIEILHGHDSAHFGALAAMARR